MMREGERKTGRECWVTRVCGGAVLVSELLYYASEPSKRCGGSQPSSSPLSLSHHLHIARQAVLDH